MLITFLQKGLAYVGIEEHLNEASCCHGHNVVSEQFSSLYSRVLFGGTVSLLIELHSIRLHVLYIHRAKLSYDVPYSVYADRFNVRCRCSIRLLGHGSGPSGLECP